MILQENQRVSIVVRGLIFRDGQLLVTQWRSSGDSFLIGGRWSLASRCSSPWPAELKGIFQPPE